MNKKEWMNHLKDLSVEELREYNSTVVALINAKQKFNNVIAMQELAVDDEVEFEGKKGQMLRGKITKLNKSTVSVLVKRPAPLPDQRWRVAANLCEKVS